MPLIKTDSKHINLASVVSFEKMPATPASSGEFSVTLASGELQERSSFSNKAVDEYYRLKLADDSSLDVRDVDQIAKIDRFIQSDGKI